MRLPATGLAVLLALPGLSGCDCGGDNYASDCLLSLPERTEGDGAEVQFRNQMVDTTAEAAEDTALDLLVSTESEPLLEDIEHTAGGSADSEIVELEQDSQSVAFDVRASATDLSIVSNQIALLQEDTTYTLVAMGRFGAPGSFELEVLEHDDQDPPDNRVSMRFLNTLSETVAPLDVVVEGNVEIDALGYGITSAFTVLDPAGGEIEVVLRDVQNNDVATVSCTVSDGETYLGVLGYAGNNAVNDDDIRLFCQSQ